MSNYHIVNFNDDDHVLLFLLNQKKTLKWSSRFYFSFFSLFKSFNPHATRTQKKKWKERKRFILFLAKQQQQKNDYDDD